VPTVPVAQNPVRPLVCPACGSTLVTTASKTIDASTYWTCGSCGEVWNVGRRQPDRANPYALPRR
jgi:predicted RNA-binding Zn-ribbon protein involved in translation (DUF1610 family)